MIRRLVVSATMLVAATSAVQAQGKEQADRQCRIEVALTEMRDACQKAVDLFNYMMPQLGTAMAGGNPTLGKTSPVGGLGHFSLGVRASAVRGSIPKFEDGDEPSTTGIVRSSYEMEEVPIPMPAVDLAVGLFKGIPLGITRLGGLDLLLSAAYVPEIKPEQSEGEGEGESENENVSLLTPDGSLKIGFGARLGLLQEGKFMPGVSVSYLQRGLPTLSIETVQPGDTEEQNDSLSLRDFKLDVSSWRVIASKKLFIIGLAVGYGMDTYKASSSIFAVVSEPCPGNPTVTCRYPDNSGGGEPEALVNFKQNVTRSNMFANLALDFKFLQLVAEVGQVSGGDITTYNTFKDAPPDKSREYASAGFRIGF
jgi:hypothetical protein